ncbi:putative major facilitator superfamily sugar transporter [Trypanosoma vivax]|nr:putative major facilitator superfamily sugar transporter [Trypanosoma vivax]
MREAVALTNEQSSPPLASHEPDGENAAPMPRRSWWDRHVTPKVVLIIFTALNFITYYDRGAIAGCLVVIKEDPSIAGQDAILSDTLSGFLFSGFMVGFMVASPLCAALGGVVSSKWVIVGGMVVWAVSCIVSGVAHSYAVLLASRILAGVGEAAFVGFSVAIIDAIAPRESRTSWIGTFYSMIPVGTSLGMALGGVISGLDPIFGVDAWRVTFISEVFVSIPIVLPIAFFPSRYNMRTESDREYLPLHKATFCADEKCEVSARCIWLCNVLFCHRGHFRVVNTHACGRADAADKSVRGSHHGRSERSHGCVWEPGRRYCRGQARWQLWSQGHDEMPAVFDAHSSPSAFHLVLPPSS